MTRDDAALRALQRIPYGLYVIGSLHEGVPVTMIGNWVTQVSFHPLCIALALEQDSRMRMFVHASGVFSLNILPSGGTEIAKKYLKGPAAEGGAIGGRGFAAASNGAPFLRDASAAIACKLLHEVEAGDHVVVFGEVVDAVVSSDDEGVLTLRETGWHYSK
jgi:flavin reductase (DIM6/NTAB) family NADH-FMN oxidoreductase RutF